MKKEIVIRVAKYLEENGSSYLRQIARDLQLHPEIVRRVLKEIEDCIIYQPVDIEGVGLPNLPTIIRLKEGYDSRGIEKWLSIRKKLKR